MSKTRVSRPIWGPEGEVNYFFDYLKEISLLSGRGLNGGFLAKVTVEGHTRIAEQATNFDSSQAFIAMWFHNSITKACEDGIRPTIEDAGYYPVRQKTPGG